MFFYGFFQSEFNRNKFCFMIRHNCERNGELFINTFCF
ncbi:putative ribonuclease [Listeria monocytogenes]|nr:putative ribonuclease [Listeria monocytogenes]